VIFLGVSPLPKIKNDDFQVVDSFPHNMKKDETRIWGVKLQVTKSPPTWEGENYKHHLPKSHQTCLVPFQLKPPFLTALDRVAFNKNWVFFLEGLPTFWAHQEFLCGTTSLWYTS